jgi:uncharacterized protein (DUF3820 family)
MTSPYLQSLLLHLHNEGLLNDNLKNVLVIHDTEFSNKPSVRMPFGAYTGKTLREIYAFRPSYIQWLSRQEYVKEKYTDIFAEVKSLLNIQ